MAQDLTATLEGQNKGEVFTSFDVDAFEVPGGRDEMWRFTPLKRLRGLHDGSAPATGSAAIEVSECPGVTVETVRRGDERLGQGGVPADRVAAQAFSSFDNATVVTVARGTGVRRADRDQRDRARERARWPTATCRSGSRNSARRSSSSICAAAEPTPTTSRSSSATPRA